MPEDAKSSPDSHPSDKYLLQRHSGYSTRSCSRCGVRKFLDRGFYRDRSSRGGYRAECKLCRNRARAAWARGRYRASTRGRYKTG